MLPTVAPPVLNALTCTSSTAQYLSEDIYAQSHGLYICYLVDAHGMLWRAAGSEEWDFGGSSRAGRYAAGRLSMAGIYHTADPSEPWLVNNS